MSRFFASVAASVVEECVAMTSGHFVPYQKLGVLVAVLVSLVFSIIVSHDVVFEVRPRSPPPTPRPAAGRVILSASLTPPTT